MKLGSFALLLLFVFFSCRKLPPKSLELGETNYPANGNAAGRILYRGAQRGDNLKVEGENLLSRVIIKTEPEGIALYFTSGKRAGKVRFYTDSGLEKIINLVPSDPRKDTDGDGFYDGVELASEEARLSFRRWFLRIAESQHHRVSGRWNQEERDCSGLIRFAYREALKVHDRNWRAGMGFVADSNVADLLPFHYPEIPLIGERIFKTGPGPDEFSTFAGARQLALYHTRLVGYDITGGEPGDLLFFYNPDNRHYNYHSMILVENRNGKIFLLYHTGEGEIIKRVSSDYLERSSYRPDRSNPNFLGVHRFAILE